VSLLAILEGSRAVVAAVTGIASAYQLTPEKAPAGLKLPSAVQEPFEGDVLWGTSQEHIIHRWYLDILTSREGDNQTEQGITIALLPLVIAAYRTNQALGLAASGVRNCRPLKYEMVMISMWQETFSAVRITMQAEEKYGVTFES
jgi:hypothetical protein